MDGEGKTYRHILLQTNTPSSPTPKTTYDTSSIFDKIIQNKDEDTAEIMKANACLSNDEPITNVPLATPSKDDDIFDETLIQEATRNDENDSIPLLQTDLSHKDQSEMSMRISNYLHRSNDSDDENSGVLETIEDDVSSIGPVENTNAVLSPEPKKIIETSSSSSCAECNLESRSEEFSLNQTIFIELNDDDEEDDLVNISSQADYFEINDSKALIQEEPLLDEESPIVDTIMPQNAFKADFENVVPMFTADSFRSSSDGSKQCDIINGLQTPVNDSECKECKEENRNEKRTETKKFIPLIRPPPKEKLQKWQNEKSQGIKTNEPNKLKEIEAITKSHSMDTADGSTNKSTSSSAHARIRQLQHLMQTWNVSDGSITTYYESYQHVEKNATTVTHPIFAEDNREKAKMKWYARKHSNDSHSETNENKEGSIKLSTDDEASQTYESKAIENSFNLSPTENEIDASQTSKANSIENPILAEKITIASAKVSDKFEKEFSHQQEQQLVEKDSSMICNILNVSSSVDGLLDNVCTSADNDFKEEAICFDVNASCIDPYKLSESRDKEQTLSIVSKKSPSKPKRKRPNNEYLYLKPPPDSPSPFETSIETTPHLLKIILSYLGNPSSVCHVKCINKACHEYVVENEHVLMRDSVRAGGIRRELRPAFWLWVLLAKCNDIKDPAKVVGANEDEESEKVEDEVADNSEKELQEESMEPQTETKDFTNRPSLQNPPIDDFILLENIGKYGEWNNLIMRDVARAFGNLPPHKTGATMNVNSIVPFLFYRPPLHYTQQPVIYEDDEADTGDESESDCDDEGGSSDKLDQCDEPFTPKKSPKKNKKSQSDLTLSGYNLTPQDKIHMQNMLERVLNAISAAHPQVGYCQGMDYIVSHLLKILKDTVIHQAKCGRLASVVRSKKGKDGEDLVVDEAVYRCMDAFFSIYGLRHMYW